MEEDLERKVREKEKAARKWQQRCEVLEREARMREDIEEMNK